MFLLIPVLWILWFLLNLVLGLAGLILIPLALKFWWVETRPSQTSGKPIFAWSKKWMWLWGNEEDGLNPLWYQSKNPKWSRFRQIFTWTAIRNSVNNLQRVPYLNCPRLEPGQLKSKSWAVSLLKGKLTLSGNFQYTGIYAGGQLFLFGKTFNYGYGFIPWESQSPTGMPENDTRDIPYISQHWS